MIDPDNSTVRTDVALVGGDRQWLRTGYDLHITDAGVDRRIPLCYSHMTIGSAKGERKNDIPLHSEGVSERQGMLKLIQGQVYFNNLDPRVPTLINGEEATFRQLKEQDEIRVAGATIRLVKLNEAVGFLEGYTDPHRKEHWSLVPGGTTVGRAGSRRGNMVELADPTVSREHATIEYSDGVFVLRAESEGATWVNSDLVTNFRVLNDEDLIQIGQQLLRFRTYRVTTPLVQPPREMASKAATILFSDIWDYTRMAEDRPLQETISQMNEMYKGLGKVIVDHQGILMSYLGDAMMAMFGTDEEHPKLAVRASLAMVGALQQLNSKWAGENKPVLRVGIGIATGEVMVGDVGVTGHREFAAMGDTTNVAARIEKLTRDFDAQILIAGATAAGLDEKFLTRALGSTEIRGRRNPVDIFEVLGAQ